MSPSRTPGAPPVIEGFEYLSVLGAGGFADVFLYEQQRPRRRVAVKVLLRSMLSEEMVTKFALEADLMAQLSTHPAIVTIYQADVAADGRPYLAMEYCPRPSLGMRYRRERLSLAECLGVGIQLAGAIESMHRAGILHRDIKPANILVTEYNRPALTDFGISATLGEAMASAEGMSIPWAPPESFADPAWSGVQSDVWSLAATVYTLVAGRTPFERPQGTNGSAELIARIERSELPPTGRADVPDALERVLAIGMAKDPLARYSSALALGRAMQQVQVQMNLSATVIDVLDDSVTEDKDDLDDEPGTRIRSVLSVEPFQATPPPAQVVESARISPAAPMEGTVLQGAAGHDDGPPLAELNAQTQPRHEASARRGRTRPNWAALTAVGIIAVALTVIVVLVLSGPDSNSVNPGPTVTDVIELPPSIESPENVAGVIEGDSVLFTWRNPDPREGDTYLVQIQDPLTDTPQSKKVDEPQLTVRKLQNARTCIAVYTVRGGKTSQSPGRGCASEPTSSAVFP